MSVFLAGATGVLGRRIVKELRGRGHAVVGLARRPENEAVIRSLGAEARAADLFDPDALARAVEGCDVMVHAATAIPTSRRYNPADWALNDRIRREGTRALTTAAGLAGARLYVQQSIVWVARPRDERAFDEDSPAQAEGVYASARDAEHICREAADKQPLTACVLRCGGFYSSDSAHTQMMAEGLRRRQLPIIGAGRNRWSQIHADDAGSAFVAAIEQGRAGLWHVTDDEAAPMAEILRYFAQQLGAPRPLRVPRWLARLLAGEVAVAYLAANTETSNARFRRDFGWSPTYPTYRNGLQQVVAELTAVASQTELGARK